MKKRVALLLVFFSFSSLYAQETGYILDKRDNQTYKVVKIGEQWWMAENLKAIKYSDGSPIPHIVNNYTWDLLEYDGIGYSYYGGDSVNIGNVYGPLYNWLTAMNRTFSSNEKPSGVQGICPDGWHVPSNIEWEELINHLGGTTAAGGMMKEIGYAHWRGPNTGATNESGFTGLPAGYRWDIGGSYHNIFDNAHFWSATEYDWNEGCYLRLERDNSVAIIRDTHKNYGQSVRCVKDSSYFYHLTGDTICHNKSISTLTSFFENTEWYSDPGRTDLIYTGDTLVFEDLDVGMHTFYSVINISETNSVMDSAKVLVKANPVIYAIEKTNETDCNTNDGQITIDASDNDPLVFSINAGKSYHDNSGEFTGLSNGNYPVVVKNTHGCKTEGSTVEIISGGDIPPAPGTSGDVVYCEGDPIGGINATSTQGGIITWYSDPGLTNVIGTGEALVPPDETGTHSYYATETVENCESSSSVVRVRIIAYELPQTVDICLVTIDLSTGNNLIIWEQSPELGIVHYNIYRETEIIDEYELIGIVDRDDLSIFSDQASDPEARQYVYKIMAVDYCGNESLLSSYHKPMFLQFNGYAGGVNLIWSDYEIEGGEISFVTYEIYRGGESGSLEKINQVSSRLDRYTDNDPEALKQKYYYRIAGVLDYPCYPSGGGKKSEEPYSHSLSNMEDNQITVSRDFKSATEPIIYPNPFDKSTTIRFHNPEGLPFTLSIMDLSGKVCRILKDITTSELVLVKGELKEGLYFIELRGPEIFRQKIIID